MTLKIQILIVLFSIALLLCLINLIRKHKIELKYALVWIFAGAIIIILACFPVLIDYLSGIIGIKSPTNMLFFLGFCFIALIMISLTVALSSTALKVKSLIQKNAVLEEELNKFRSLLEKKEKEKD